jgi:hypothetical protein
MHFEIYTIQYLDILIDFFYYETTFIRKYYVYLL